MDNKMHLIIYDSQKLTSVKINYSIIEKRLLAINLAILT